MAGFSSCSESWWLPVVITAIYAYVVPPSSERSTCTPEPQAAASVANSITLLVPPTRVCETPEGAAGFV